MRDVERAVFIKRVAFLEEKKTLGFKLNRV